MAFLEVKGLTKAFQRTEVLRGVNFQLEKGQVLSLIGSSGSGKTTLLRCLNALETPDSGSITLNGREIFTGGSKAETDAARKARCRHFGMVFQSFNLFPQYTVLDNLMLAPLCALKRDKSVADREAAKEALRLRADNLLARVGLSEKAKEYPCRLSGGQQQRVAIARALMLDPAILCFDEPTSALDPELTGEVLRVIRDLKSADSTMIVVTHELEFARHVSDKIIYMADGVVEEEGTPEQVFTAPKSERTKSFISSALNHFEE